MTAAGMVERSVSMRDRRVKLVSLTPKVWQVLAEHYGPSGRRVLKTAAALDPMQLQRMIDDLVHVSEAIRPSTP